MALPADRIQKPIRNLRKLLKKTARRLNKGLKRISHKVEKVLPASSAAREPDKTAAAEAAAAAWQRVSELANTSQVGRANLHSYLLQVKALQNLLKMADCNGNKFVKELGELKNAIGEWYDWDELRVRG